MECGSNPIFFFFFLGGGGGGGYCHIWAIWVCAAVKGMVFNSGSLLWDRVYKSS